jgi:hypothetical protein
MPSDESRRRSRRGSAPRPASAAARGTAAARGRRGTGAPTRRHPLSSPARATTRARRRQRRDVHHLVAAREAVLRQHLAGAVDQQRDAHARLAHEPVWMGSRSASTSRGRSAASCQRRRRAVRLQPDQAELRVALRHDDQDQVAAPTATTWPSSASSCSVPGAELRRLARLRRAPEQRCASAATAVPFTPSLSSATTGTPASLSTMSAPRTPGRG